MEDNKLDKIGTKDPSLEVAQSKIEAPNALSEAKTAEIEAICQKLDKIDPKTKVRVIFKDYALWREFLPFYNKYKNKFEIFKDKKDFLISDNMLVKAKTEMTTLKESMLNYLDKTKIDDLIKKTLLEELDADK